jgi:hypothetical protein
MSMRMIAAFALLAAVPLTACGEEPEVSQAETPTPVDPVDTATENVTADPPAGTSAGWDTNNDRNFDRAEFTGYGDRGFLGWDNDNDRRLSRTEFDAGWTEAGWREPGTAFTAFDDNNDTFLGEDEFFGEDEFTEWDRNANGMLETEEWTFGAA